MIDANQRWGVQESIDWVTQLKEYKPLWIEEPTSPDDILGHAAIAKVRTYKMQNANNDNCLLAFVVILIIDQFARQALKPHGIGVATGEMCQNRVIFKQLLQDNAISFCQ